MKQCFGYVRVSTVKQGDGVSLEAQREAIIAFASRHDIAIKQWFEEKETAAKRGRPVFNKMVGELQRGKAQGLVVHKIDRSARNFTDWAKIGDLQDAGIDIHFATKTLDFGSRGGRLTADIQAVIAADFIRNLREETKKGITGRLKQGLYPFKAPIGYLDNGGGKLKTFDPLRASLVKLAFELYATRTYSLRPLLAELNRRGLTNSSGQPLTLCGLETLLNNLFYCGIIRIKRTGMIYKGAHDRLISPNLFERVQNIKSGRSGPKITSHNHLYRGLFRCGLCDGPMVPERQKGHVYYRCPKPTCPTKTVREETLIEAVELCLERTQLTDQDMKTAYAAIDTWVTTAQSDDAQKAWSLKMASLQNRIDRLTDALIDRLIDQDAYTGRRQRLAMEEETLNQERAELANLGAKASNMRTIIELAKSLHLSHQLGDAAEKRQMVEMAISNRIVRGKNVYLEPSNWLSELKKTVGVLCGAPARDTDRTSIDVLSGVDRLSKLIEPLKLPNQQAAKRYFETTD
jgi:site-specific DNA recombinase